MSKITVSIGVRWWLKPWIALALILNSTVGWRPTEQQIQAVARRAAYIRKLK